MPTRRDGCDEDDSACQRHGSDSRHDTRDRPSQRHAPVQTAVCAMWCCMRMIGTEVCKVDGTSIVIQISRRGLLPSAFRRSTPFHLHQPPTFAESAGFVPWQSAVAPSACQSLPATSAAALSVSSPGAQSIAPSSAPPRLCDAAATMPLASSFFVPLARPNSCMQSDHA